MFAPGGIALAIALLLLVVIKDDPEAAGAPFSQATLGYCTRCTPWLRTNARPLNLRCISVGWKTGWLKQTPDQHPFRYALGANQADNE